MSRPVVKSIDEVLDEISPGRFHVIVISLAGCAYVCDGLAANMIGFSSNCAGDEFTLTTNQVSRVPMALFSGAIVGAIFFAQYADIFGRKAAMFMSILWIICSFIFTGIVSSFGALLFGWFLVGCGAGGTGIAFDYISEVVSIKSRVSGFVLQLYWPISTTIVGTLAWMLLDHGHSWRTLILILCIPALIVYCCISMYLPESGRWLLDEKRYDEAENVVKIYAEMNGTVLEPFSFSRGILEQPESIAESVHSGMIRTDDETCIPRFANSVDKFKHGIQVFWKKTFDLFNDKMRGTTLAMSFIFFVSCLSVYGGVLLQVRVLKEDSDSGCYFEFGQYLLSGPAELAAGLIVVFTTDTQGRRWNMATWYFTVAVFCLILGCGVEGTAAAYTGLLGLRFSSFGANIASWTPATELYSTKYRASAFSFCYIMSRIGAITASLLVDSELQVSTISLIIGLFAVLATFVSLSVKETVGQPID
jgi:MFS family permease